MTRVATFEVHHTRFIDRDGRSTQALPACAKDRDTMVAMYRAMVLTRTFDTKAVAMQRTGRLGTYPSSLGQEAIAVGVGVAMTPEDVLLPYAREQGTQLLRGVTLSELFLFWGGDERGNDFGTPRQDFPVTVPVATHVPHAAGVAMAFKLRGERRAAVCLFGDGATSKGISTRGSTWLASGACRRSSSSATTPGRSRCHARRRPPPRRWPRRRSRSVCRANRWMATTWWRCASPSRGRWRGRTPVGGRI